MAAVSTASPASDWSQLPKVRLDVGIAGGKQRKAGKRKSGRVRSVTLRRAFNCYSWPNVLCTTSIGQERLDFHQWCRRVVHWDLPSDPACPCYDRV
jgi:hypothetical protein